MIVSLERVTGIEPVSSAWKADIISRYTIPALKSGWRDLNPRSPGPKPGALAN